MNREIKFRTYLKDYEMMVSVDYINLYLNEIIVDIKNSQYEFEIGEYELMQYTRLNDKHGTPIYEGDILEFEDMGEEGYEYKEGYDFINRAVVTFENGRYQLTDFLDTNSGALEEMNDECHDELVTTFESSEVIGNIYENPELLEVKS